MKKSSKQSQLLSQTMENVDAQVDTQDVASLPKKKKVEKGSFLALVRLFPDLTMEAWKTLEKEPLFHGWLPVEIDNSQLNSKAIGQLIALSLNTFSETLALKSEEQQEPCFVQANEKHFLFFGIE